VGLYKRNKVWWYTVVHRGQRIQESTKTDNKKLAERIYAKVLFDIQEGRWFENQAKRKTLKEMIERYEKEYTEFKTYYQNKRDKSVFKHLCSFLGEICTLEDIENRIGGYEMFRKSKVKPSTILKELALLRRMFNVARKQWKWKIPNPVSDIELPKVNNARIRYLSDAESSQLMNVLDQLGERWLKPFVIIALETGLRLSNICNLTWPEVNMSSRVIFISAEKMKNNDHIGIPLSDLAYETLKEVAKVSCISNHVFHDDGHYLYPVKVQRAFRKALKFAQISDFHFHDLRHSFASSLVQEGVDIYAVQKLLGHKDSRMTQRYAHLSTDYLRDAINRKKKSATNLLHSEVREQAISL
jgi:integrase